MMAIVCHLSVMYSASYFLLLDSVIRQRSHVIMSYLVGFLWVVKMQAKWQLVEWFQILHAAFGF